MAKRNFFRDNSKKLMALFSAVLMILFFLPSLAGSGGRGNDGKQPIATVYGNENISALQSQAINEEWRLLTTRLMEIPPQGSSDSTQEIPLANILGQPAIQQLQAKPDGFLLLVMQAHKLGIGVSNDQYQEVLKSQVANFPDESDPSYDRSLAAVHDLLLVNNLLNRVSDVVKISQPRGVLALAITQQSVALNVVFYSSDHYIAATTQPTPEQTQKQYDLYSHTLPGTPDATDPLGFGYLLPDRVKLQYIGFSMTELRTAAKAAQPAIEWQMLARRLYRTHPTDFAVTPTTNPTTQPIAETTPDWDNLPAETSQKVYDQVYDSAAADLAKKIQDQLTDVLGADWLSYHNAVGSGAAAPVSSLGPAFNTDEYLHALADKIQKEYGVRPILGIDNGSFKSAKELATLEGIGKATMASGAPFSEYATVVGDQFQAAANVPATLKLSLWEPSEPVYVGATSKPDAFYIFRLTAMDPSHTPPLDQVRKDVNEDIRLTRAWNSAIAAADKLAALAKTQGLESASHQMDPNPIVLTTGFFNPGNPGDSIQGLALPATALQRMAVAARDLIARQTPAAEHGVISVQLPEVHQVAVVELKATRADWQDASDRQMRQSELAMREELQYAQQLEQNWTNFDTLSKVTQYQEKNKAP
jgi:hypothetical protein